MNIIAVNTDGTLYSLYSDDSNEFQSNDYDDEEQFFILLINFFFFLLLFLFLN